MLRFPLFIDLGHSRVFLTLLAATHFLATLGVLATPWPFFARLLLTGGIALGFAMAFRQWRAMPSRLVLHADGRLEVGDARQTTAVTLCPGAMILSWLCIFSWQEEDVPGRQTLVLFPDSAPEEKLRHLRIWLRYAKNTPV
ncbi:MAG: hypothetical protein LBO00_09680 [Zoogloeaceae bacterium]|jgi:hypothetical protein|nr:hypothetical protein [Zoogloeaceae bacterium]